jgi:hypothetical protein
MVPDEVLLKNPPLPASAPIYLERGVWSWAGLLNPLARIDQMRHPRQRVWKVQPVRIPISRAMASTSSWECAPIACSRERTWLRTVASER